MHPAMKISVVVVLCLLQRASCMPQVFPPQNSYLPPIGDPAPAPPPPPPPPPPPSKPASSDYHATPTCSDNCPFDYDPVCGSDGVTYTNDCTFSAAVCKNPRLKREGIGACVYRPLSDFGDLPPPPAPSQFIPEGPALSSVPGSGVIPFPPVFGAIDEPEPLPILTEGCNEACTKIYKPVCGTDGVTYNNECLYDLAVCRGLEASSGFQLSIAHDGECANDLFESVDVRGSVLPREQPECDEQCTKIFKPVCGSDGNTYNNLCILEVESCKNVNAGSRRITLDYEGHCVAILPEGPQCNERCVKTFLPVCGSDGETYNNICLLELADCLNPLFSINYVSDGACGSVQSSSDFVQSSSSDFGDTIQQRPLPNRPVVESQSNDNVPYQGYLTPA